MIFYFWGKQILAFLGWRCKKNQCVVGSAQSSFNQWHHQREDKMQRRGDLARRSKSGQQIKTAPDCDLLPTPEKRDIDPNLDVGRSFLGFFLKKNLENNLLSGYQWQYRFNHIAISVFDFIFWCIKCLWPNLGPGEAIFKCICPNCKMYLSKLQNAFVWFHLLMHLSKLQNVLFHLLRSGRNYLLGWDDIVEIHLPNVSGLLLMTFCNEIPLRKQPQGPEAVLTTFPTSPQWCPTCQRHFWQRENSIRFWRSSSFQPHDKSISIRYQY